MLQPHWFEPLPSLFVSESAKLEKSGFRSKHITRQTYSPAALTFSDLRAVAEFTFTKTKGDDTKTSLFLDGTYIVEVPPY